MSRLTVEAITEKGVLGAIVATGTEYLRNVFVGHVRNALDEPARTIVHRAPHIDEYFAELLFRASTVGGAALPEFRELPLFSRTNDHAAERYWPGSAVFGMGDMGAKFPRLRSLPLHIFDEHDQGSGRSAASCLALVLRERFVSTPPAIDSLVTEINQIDGFGGAHEQHLGNAIKTMHNHRYFMGETSQGGKVQRALDEHWKWALVNGLLSAAIWAIQDQVNFRTSGPMLSMLERFSAVNPMRDEPSLQRHINRTRSLVADERALARAALDIGGRQHAQQLLVPYVAAAATEFWGEELAYFLVEPFIEAEIAGQVSFERIQTLVAAAMKARPPEEVHEADVSVTPWIVKGCRFRGRKQEGGGKSSAAPSDSNLWVLYCSSDGTVAKAKQALDNYIVKHNYGVGLVLIENRTEGTKALFRCRFLDEGFFEEIVKRIRKAEPEYWYRVREPSPTVSGTPFILNGNATHMYVPKSSLTHWSLDRVCKDVYTQGAANP